MLKKIDWAEVALKAGLLAMVSQVSGCAGSQQEKYRSAETAWAQSSGPVSVDPLEKEQDKRTWAEDDDVLERRTFVEEVLARNPSLVAARQAWKATLAERAQERALEDPTLEYSFAPLSITSNDVPYGHVITLSQKLPWPGKKALAGEVALAEAEAAQGDFEAVRLRLALMASLLFDQYYAVERSLELNDQHQALARDIATAALAQYEAGRASQQEPLQAEIELAHVDHQRIVLATRKAIVVAQMNGLLHREPEAKLPPPPKTLDITAGSVEQSRSLQKEAIANRPELRSQGATIRAREVGRDLAERESYPDFGVMASYNSMWLMPEHRWMLGLSMNVPLQLGKRRGAVEENEARLAEAQAELASLSDEIRVAVEAARQRLIEAGHVVNLYRTRLLPAARAQIEAAQSGYITGQTGFQALIDAERSLRNVELNFQEALATLGQRRAELAHSLGRIPGLDEGESK